MNKKDLNSIHHLAIRSAVELALANSVIRRERRNKLGAGRDTDYINTFDCGRNETSEEIARRTDFDHWRTLTRRVAFDRASSQRHDTQPAPSRDLSTQGSPQLPSQEK